MTRFPAPGFEPWPRTATWCGQMLYPLSCGELVNIYEYILNSYVRCRTQCKDQAHKHRSYSIGRQESLEIRSCGDASVLGHRKKTKLHYKIIQIVRALWLAIKPFYMSVCKHGFRSSFISYLLDKLETTLLRVVVSHAYLVFSQPHACLHQAM